MIIPTSTDLERLRAIATELDVADSMVEPGDLDGLERIGRMLHGVIEGRLRNLPPATPGSADQWARLRPILDAIGAMQERELVTLRELEATAVAELQPIRSELPDRLIETCRRTIAEIDADKAVSAFRDASLFRHVAVRVEETGDRVASRLQRRLHGHLHVAIDSLHALALTWERLHEALRRRASFPATEPDDSLRDRLNARRERLRPEHDATERGELHHMLDLDLIRTRVATILAPCHGPSDCLDVIRATLSTTWYTWELDTETALRDHCARHFATLAHDLDRWLDDSRHDVARQCGLIPDQALQLRAFRTEIADICALEVVS